ncbi:MAG: hypothetical protein HYS27_24120 [Deltaproteobacteria bacterium]|nr:hypothetical protein [Deltaproteobacteria bacterium]
MFRTNVLFCLTALSPLAGCLHQLDDAPAAEAELAAEGAPLVPAPSFLGDPEAGAVFALDISFWEGPVSEEEIECFWDSGVRHIVTGTQVLEITRQQLDVAIARGMTVDAYEYLYWDQDMAQQVDEAMAIVEDRPVGRLWLDVEEDPDDLGANTIIAKVQQAVDRCREYEQSHGIECGIYTGPGFWRTYLNNTTRFADVPLWYAWYNFRTSLSSWDEERFGGWDTPTAKQWAEQAICGYGADKNTMIVTEVPTVVVEHDPAPISATAPPAPARLWPSTGTVTLLDYTKLMSGVVPGATRYQFALERFTGTRWLTYFTWTTANAFRSVYPASNLLGYVYRFRVRAQNARGWGEWSSWAQFDWGNVAGVRPDAPPPPEQPPPEQPPPAQPPPEQPPPVAGAPTGLAPDGARVTSTNVTLSCAAIAGASDYAFTIETRDAAGALHPYFSYQRTAPAATFWPQLRNATYVWRVRARSNGAWGPWSTDASFTWP